MELEVGRIYKSPYHGREIKISSLMDRGDSYTMVILWLEPDSDFDEIDEITVSKDDVKRWKLVK